MAEDKKRAKLRDRRNGAMYRVFMNESPGDEDATIVREILAEICKINDASKMEGFNGLVDIVQREGKRDVYVKIVSAISAGRKVVTGGGWTDIADSGGEEG